MKASIRGTRLEIKVWDDTRRKGKRSTEWSDKWGAGWIAYPVQGKTSRWFNIKAWGSWRLAFVLARLQRTVWLQRHAASAAGPAPPGGEADAAAGGSPDAAAGALVSTPSKRGRPKAPAQAAAGDDDGGDRSGKKGRRQPAVAAPRALPAGAQQTLLAFFDKRLEPTAPAAAPAASAPAPKQRTLLSFFKKEPGEGAPDGAPHGGAAASVDHFPGDGKSVKAEVKAEVPHAALSRDSTVVGRLPRSPPSWTLY